MTRSSLVTPDWLREHLKDPALAVVDCRFELADPEAGRRAYEKGHIPGAIYMDLEKDLSGEVGEHGGRHPLPEWDAFVRKLNSRGIDQSKTVVAYDSQGGAMAARLWWMLRYLGHPRVALLDGGFDAWVKKGYPVTDAVPSPEPAQFVPRFSPDRIASMEEVRGSNGILIDSREPERYEGVKEPIDKKAGHIPGAVNVFWKNHLLPDKRWKPAEELKRAFSFIPEGETPIVYCGSGVTACANLFALHLAGRDDVKLYPGSWSDWISYPENPVVKGKEPEER